MHANAFRNLNDADSATAEVDAIPRVGPAVSGYRPITPIGEAAQASWPTIKRGFIVPMFDGMLPIGISLIQELRRLGNHDLVQVYHCLGELSALSLRLLHRADSYVEVVDVCADMVAQDKLTWHEAKRFRNFFIKPLALVHTRLDEVILLDADDILFVDPATLWDVDAFHATGAMFFYDREIVENTFLRLKYSYVDPLLGHVTEENTLQQLFRLFEFHRFGLAKPAAPSVHAQSSLAFTNQSAHEQDSSIVVVDKRRHDRAMDVLWFLITDWRFRFPMYSWGDKENFWLAYELSQSPYSFSPYAATAAGNVQPHDPTTVCGEIAHFFPSSSPNTTLLHINGNALINPYTKTNAFNGYDKSFRPSKLDMLLQMVPTHVAPPRERSPTPIVQPNASCPQECLYQRGVQAMTSAQQRALVRRIHDTFAVAADVDAETPALSRYSLVGVKWELLGAMPSMDAATKYIDIVNDVLPGWDATPGPDKFFFVLLVRKGSVGIYTHEDDMAPVEVYKLAGYTIRVKSEKRRPHQFKVEHATLTPIRLCVSSLREMNEWITAFSQAIDACNASDTIRGDSNHVV
ncbi:hypothetical protein DYB36_008921 [Aphanomyces astaci]|uniref:PH domain-containing protein n=1 Tax=Aphanomyces astaci TaxID=112090 RepID=A0A397B1T8_APHAT|nr:hypothetical protein DYB36_008921 [Aphanomyces astaci]